MKKPEGTDQMKKNIQGKTVGIIPDKRLAALPAVSSLHQIIPYCWEFFGAYGCRMHEAHPSLLVCVKS